MWSGFPGGCRPVERSETPRNLTEELGQVFFFFKWFFHDWGPFKNLDLLAQAIDHGSFSASEIGSMGWTRAEKGGRNSEGLMGIPSVMCHVFFWLSCKTPWSIFGVHT